MNPSIIYASNSGFGPEGDWSRNGSMDAVCQAMSGAAVAQVVLARVQLAEAKTQLDVPASSLCYVFEGCELEPAACVDDRGVAAQCKLMARGGNIGHL